MPESEQMRELDEAAQKLGANDPDAEADAENKAKEAEGEEG